MVGFKRKVNRKFHNAKLHTFISIKHSLLFGKVAIVYTDQLIPRMKSVYGCISSGKKEGYFQRKLKTKCFTLQFVIKVLLLPASTLFLLIARPSQVLSCVVLLRHSLRVIKRQFGPTSPIDNHHEPRLQHKLCCPFCAVDIGANFPSFQELSVNKTLLFDPKVYL